jgi:hypothetical protein
MRPAVLASILVGILFVVPATASAANSVTLDGASLYSGSAKVSGTLHCEPSYWGSYEYVTIEVRQRQGNKSWNVGQSSFYADCPAEGGSVPLERYVVSPDAPFKRGEALVTLSTYTSSATQTFRL